MKKNINDYKGTETAIEVNSIEEFDRIKELLGHNQKGINCFKKSHNYISCFIDGYDNKEWWINKGFTLYKASDFLEEVPKFEEGKWYKVNDKYTKFLILENESLILGSEHIYNNKHYISELKTGTWISKLSDNPVLLTDLSEIQQYLPLNHPDLKALGNNNVIDYKLSTKTAYEAQNKLIENDLLTNEIYEFDTKKLIIGEIYYRHNFIFDHVSKINYSRNNTAISITEKAFFNENAGLYAYNEKPERLATDEEKKWLKVCKNENKFIPKENLHFYDDSGLLIKKEKSLEKQVEEGLNKSFQYPLAPKESFFTETDKMIINGFVMGNGQIFKNNIDSEDIYIIPITKRKKEIQTITIESITNLNLNLKTIKPKQIQTIKI